MNCWAAGYSAGAVGCEAAEAGGSCSSTYTVRYKTLLQATISDTAKHTVYTVNDKD